MARSSLASPSPRPSELTLYNCPELAAWLIERACQRLRARPTKAKRGTGGEAAHAQADLVELLPGLGCPGVVALAERREAQPPRRA